MDYDDIIQYLYAMPRGKKEKNAPYVKEILQRMGNLQKHLKIIQIVGTNGKGSVCAYLSNIFLEHGISVGMFTSPHLMKINERFLINHKPVTNQTFVKAFHYVQSIIQQHNEDKMISLTFFEYVFLMSIYIFSSLKAEYVIMEAGIGGKSDITSIIEEPILTIISQIGLEHQDILGNTIEEIAYDKADIMKENSIVVSNSQNEIADIIIEKVADNKNCELFMIKNVEYKILENYEKSIAIYIKTGYYIYDRVQIQGLAYYQLYNITTVLLAIEALKKLNITFCEHNILQGIQNTQWAGRMEEITDNFYIDGAHNVTAIGEFLKTVKFFFENKKKCLIFGVLEHKDYFNMIDIIIQSGLFDKIIVTEIQHKNKANINSIYNKFMEANCNVHLCHSLHESVQLGNKIKGEGVVFAVGSLYLVSQIKELQFMKGI